MQHTSIQVLDSKGYPRSYTLVELTIYHADLFEKKTQQFTDCDGKVFFLLYVRESTNISISVDGVERVRKSPVKSEYKLAMYN